jgi:transketolase
MRKVFFEELYKQMKANNNIYALTGDLGFIGFDKIKKDFINRFINCGASEQSMLDIAVGLAYSGKIPVVYSITPFLIYRGFETIKLYINHEKLPVILVGSGRNKDYKTDGPSHDATDIPAILKALQSLKTYFPKSSEEIPELLDKVIKEQLPTFISLIR